MLRATLASLVGLYWSARTVPPALRRWRAAYRDCTADLP